MPFVTHENLPYIVRGIRRHIYGRGCEGAPECHEQILAWVRNSTKGLCASLAVFGPLERFGRCVRGYGMIWVMRSIGDCLDRGSNYHTPEAELPVLPLERLLDSYLAEHPGCDLVVVLHGRVYRTSAGWDIDARRDPAYRACRLQEQAADLERRRS